MLALRIQARNYLTKIPKSIPQPHEHAEAEELEMSYRKYEMDKHPISREVAMNYTQKELDQYLVRIDKKHEKSHLPLTKWTYHPIGG